MINPNFLEAKSKRWNYARFAGGKMYLAVLSGAGYAKASRLQFRRASEAQDYARRLLETWKRVYRLPFWKEPEPAPEPTE